MNISLAIEKFDPHVGGAERYCWDLAHFLAERGHCIEVICRKGSVPSHEAIHLTHVRTPAFPQFLKHLSFALAHFFKARKLPGYRHLCVGNAFYMDLYQPHGGVHRAWFLRETLRFRRPYRTLYRILMRMSPKDMVHRAVEWWVFSVTRPQVIAISRMVASDIVQYFSYPQDRVHCIPNGVDTRRYHPGNRIHCEEIRRRYGLGLDEYVFLFVAQNPKLKGYDVLMDACRACAPVPFRVLVAGPYDHRMRREAEFLGERIVFAGRVDDLHKIYPACDCLVHPTYYDACSLVVLEALASGIPVITTSANGANMYLEEGDGEVIEPGDARSLAAAMRNAMENRVGGEAAGRLLHDHKEVFSRVEELIQQYG